MKIKTNHHYRPVLYWNDLTVRERFEHVDAYEDVEESSFFRYQGWTYDLNDFTRVITNNMQRQGIEHVIYGWDGYKNETYFSSVLVKYSEDCEAVKVGLALS